jgi:hypothetical protein
MSESSLIIMESLPLMITHSGKVIILVTFVLRRLQSHKALPQSKQSARLSLESFEMAPSAP